MNKLLTILAIGTAISLAACSSGTSGSSSSPAFLSGMYCIANGHPTPSAYESSLVTPDTASLNYFGYDSAESVGNLKNAIYAGTGFSSALDLTESITGLAYIVESQPTGLASGMVLSVAGASGGACLTGIYFQGTIDTGHLQYDGESAPVTVTGCSFTESPVLGESYNFTGTYNITAANGIPESTGTITFNCPSIESGTLNFGG